MKRCKERKISDVEKLNGSIGLRFDGDSHDFSGHYCGRGYLPQCSVAPGRCWYYRVVKNTLAERARHRKRLPRAGQRPLGNQLHLLQRRRSGGPGESSHESRQERPSFLFFASKQAWPKDACSPSPRFSKRRSCRRRTSPSCWRSCSCFRRLHAAYRHSHGGTPETRPSAVQEAVKAEKFAQ